MCRYSQHWFNIANNIQYALMLSCVVISVNTVLQVSGSIQINMDKIQ